MIVLDSVEFERAVDEVRLDDGGFAFWTQDAVRSFERDEFWSIAAGYAAMIEHEPRIGAFNLIVARTSMDMMALFVAMITCDRRVSFFPPNTSRQDAGYYIEQQREAIGRIAPSAILMFGDEGTGSLEKIGGEIAGAVIVLEKLSGVTCRDGATARDAFATALADPDRLLFWQHSSGTTGIKKAVAVTSAMLIGQLVGYWPIVRKLAGGDQVKVASWLPLYHDMGLLATFLLPLLGGADIAIQDPVDWIDQPDLFLRMIAGERSTVTWMPNFAFRHFTRLVRAMPDADLSSMRLWVSCSEPVRHRDGVAFERSYAGRGVVPGSVVGCYAMAESVFAASQLDPAERRALSVPAGIRPGDIVPPDRVMSEETAERDASAGQLVLSSGTIIPGLEAAIFVAGVRTAGDGVYGEIGLVGDFVFSGYRNTSAAGSGIREDGFFLTGDLGTIIGRHLYVFGRSKEIIIVNGKNIYAGDVEDHLNLIDGIKGGRVVAFGVDNDRTGSEDLIVVAERRADAVASAEDLVQSISASLSAAFLVTPFDVRVVESQWLVKSTSGKISRAGNRDKYLEQF